jgi:WD40 repeat protein
MSPSRFTICVALISVAGAAGADPSPSGKVDQVGDPLPPGAIARIGSARFLPRPHLTRVFFTADGKTVFGLGSDSVVQFWDAETGKTIFELRDPDLINFRIDQSPDGKRLALFGHDKRGRPAPDTALRVYDLATRKQLWTQVIDDVYYYRHAIRYSLDGKHLITGTNGELRVWDAITGDVVTKQKTGIGYTGLIMSPDGKLVAGGENTLWVWDWKEGGPPRPINPGRQYFNSLAFSPDAKTIYVSQGTGTAVGYDVATGSFVGTADESVLRWRAVSPDGKTDAVAGYDKDKKEGFVTLRDVGSGREVGRLSSGPTIIVDGRWSKDGTKLVGAGAYRCWVWDVKSGKAFGPTVPSHNSQVTQLAFTSDGRLLSSSDDSTIRAWDPNTGKELSRLQAGAAVWQFAASPDGSLMASSSFDPGTVHVWDSKSNKEVFKLTWSLSRTGGVQRIVFTADDQSLLTFSHDWYVRSWDLLTGKLKVERRFRPDALLGPEREDGAGNDVEYTLSTSADLGADGDTLVLAFQKDVAVYSLATGKERFKVEADEQYVSAVALSKDCKRLATIGLGPRRPPNPAAGIMDRPTHNQLTVWDLSRAERVVRFPVPASNNSIVLTFTPDGKQVVTATGDERLLFWDTKSGAAVGQIELPRPASRVTFSHDGTRLAVGFRDPNILVYDIVKAMKPPAKE